MANAPFTGISSLPSAEPRVVNEFDVPRELCGRDGATIGVVELTPDEELMASRRSGGDQMALAIELAKGALAEVDGKPVTLGDGTTDTAWNQFPAAVRALVVTAYAEVNTPSQKVVQGFIKSRRVKAG